MSLNIRADHARTDHDNRNARRGLHRTVAAPIVRFRIFSSVNIF
jgi:hypothetical protein